MSMRDDLKKRDGESKNSFIFRVYDSKLQNNMTNNDCKEFINKELGTEYAESTLRGIYKVIAEYKEELIESKDNDLIKEIEEKRIELEKEKVKYRDQKREYMNFIRQEARWENLRDCLLDEVKNINHKIPLELDCINFSISQGNKACLLISDLHIGSMIDTNINKYSMEVAQERLNELESKTISYCRLHGVEELNVELLGDLISGIIHISTRLYNEENIIQQTIKCSEMLGRFICNIANNIHKINIYYSVGNHGRCVANYKEHLDEENFEYLIKWYLQGRLEKISNIEFKDNEIDDEIAIINIFDKKIASVHGHKDKPQRALDKLRGFTGVMVNEIHMGHLHNFQIKDGVLINGCMSGVDKYSQSMRFNNEPSQVLKIYYSNGDECIHNINLK